VSAAAISLLACWPSPLFSPAAIAGAGIPLRPTSAETSSTGGRGPGVRPACRTLAGVGGSPCSGDQDEGGVDFRNILAVLRCAAGDSGASAGVSLSVRLERKAFRSGGSGRGPWGGGGRRDGAPPPTCGDAEPVVAAVAKIGILCAVSMAVPPLISWSLHFGDCAADVSSGSASSDITDGRLDVLASLDPRTCGSLCSSSEANSTSADVPELIDAMDPSEVADTDGGISAIRSGGIVRSSSTDRKMSSTLRERRRDGDDD